MAEFNKHAGCKHSQGCRFYRSLVHDARNSLSRTTEDLSRSLRWINVFNLMFDKISDWWGQFVIMSVTVKELSEVGKNLPSRAGVSEPNREKNRYPYILPCKCKQTTESDHVNVRCFALIALYFFLTTPRYRRPLPGEAVYSKRPSTLWLHQRQFCARKSLYCSWFFIVPSTPICIYS